MDNFNLRDYLYNNKLLKEETDKEYDQSQYEAHFQEIINKLDNKLKQLYPGITLKKESGFYDYGQINPNEDIEYEFRLDKGDTYTWLTVLLYGQQNNISIWGRKMEKMKDRLFKKRKGEWDDKTLEYYEDDANLGKGMFKTSTDEIVNQIVQKSKKIFN